MNTKNIILLVFLSLFVWSANAQITSFPFSEGFEGATFPPASCTQSQQNETTNWTSRDGNQRTSSKTIFAYAGTKNAIFYTSSRGNKTQLITPAMDITSLTSPRFIFWHTQEAWGSDQDTLALYYKTAATGNWTLLASYSSSVTTWIERTINLPNGSNYYYIAFKATSDWGYGVTIDEFTAEATPSCAKPNALTTTNITGDSATLGWTENTTATFTLTNQEGCDSIISLDLTIRSVDKTITNNDPELEATLVSGAQYQWLDCTNGFAIVEGATENVYRATDNSFYAVEITVNGCIDTSGCVSIAKASLFGGIFNEVNVYPNSTNGVVNISLGDLTSVSIKVYDLNGKVIFEEARVPSSNYQFELNATAGMYILEVNSNDQLMRTRIIKQ